MLNRIFQGVFDTQTTQVIDVSDFVLCLVVALALGGVLAFAYMYRTRYTQSFVMTLALLPAVVCIVIMMVNGNIGTGVAVAGAFGLVRFRSAPGSAKEICALFLAMGTGLIVGMGYLGYAALFTFLMSAMFMLYNRVDFGKDKKEERYRTLTITIPENLNYSDVFDDIFHAYTASCDLVKVKTTNMGSLFRLTYRVALLDRAKEKEMIDQLRCRNGNLEITLSQREAEHGDL